MKVIIQFLFGFIQGMIPNFFTSTRKAIKNPNVAILLGLLESEVLDTNKNGHFDKEDLKIIKAGKYASWTSVIPPFLYIVGKFLLEFAKTFIFIFFLFFGTLLNAQLNGNFKLVKSDSLKARVDTLNIVNENESIITVNDTTLVSYIVSHAPSVADSVSLFNGGTFGAGLYTFPDNVYFPSMYISGNVLQNSGGDLLVENVVFSSNELSANGNGSSLPMYGGLGGQSANIELFGNSHSGTPSRINFNIGDQTSADLHFYKGADSDILLTSLDQDGDWDFQSNDLSGINEGSISLASLDSANISGDLDVNGKVSIGDQSSAVISSGTLACSSGYQRVDTEGGAAVDTLVTITGGVGGNIYVLTPVSGSRDVFMDDGGDNLRLNGDFLFQNSNDAIIMIYNSDRNVWIELSRSEN